MTYSGVIDTATGDLLRCGYCAFTAGEGESVRNDVPHPGKVRLAVNATPFHRYSGSEWIEVPPGVGDARKLRYSQIDQRTVELIHQGYSYAGKVFSLSDNSQRWLSGLKAGLDLMGPDDWPLKINTLDDSESYSIVDSTDALYLYGSAMATVKAHLGSGTDIKDQIRAASTIAEVEAVEDTR